MFEGGFSFFLLFSLYDQGTTGSVLVLRIQFAWPYPSYETLDEQKNDSVPAFLNIHCGLIGRDFGGVLVEAARTLQECVPGDSESQYCSSQLLRCFADYDFPPTLF